MLQEVVPANVDTLYLDSNSIVYDCYYALIAENAALPDIDTRLCNAVVDKICSYISYVRPSRTFVAFDGVAPLSKMDQQRLRRHKTLFTPFEKSSLQGGVSNTFTTNSITPGTPFMHLLSQILHQAFDQDSTVVLSTSEEPGEGEHKLFADMRNRQEMKEQNADHPVGNATGGVMVVYGLDADLIMLSLLHLRYCGELWIFREAPHWNREKKGIKEEKMQHNKPSVMQQKEKDQVECLHLNVRILAGCLLQEMGYSYDMQRIYDYVFLCFFLGNDFLPHFPCLNIRTHGMPYLIGMYRECMKQGQYLVNRTGEIDWHHLRKWLQICALREPEWFTQEREARDKMASSMWRGVEKGDLQAMLDQTPLLFRAEEYYIDAPLTVGWQQRYYRVLFGVETAEKTASIDNKEKKENKIETICSEYLKGLQWVWQYYTAGCTDWRWRYTYTYAPLMQDLVTHYITPVTNIKNLAGTVTEGYVNATGPLPSNVQLAYVMPRKNHASCITDSDYVAMLGSKYGDLYVDSVSKFTWSYCRYFWEAHPILPEISMDIISEWDNYLVSN